MNDLSLQSKYTRETGRIILSGIQALVRLPLDQHRADKRRGLNTATFISGYRGSPLGGLDITLQGEERLLKAHQVVFMPGVNEDLGATAVFGSQIANLLPKPKYDGVLGMWYGKGPGVDRAGDILRHAQFAGVGRNGGVLAIAGDDPTAKSSTIPSHSEIPLYDAQMPVLYPGNVQEILDLGRLGFELSRYSGSWVGFKVVTNVADEYGTANVEADNQITRPVFEYGGKPWEHTQTTALLAPYSLNQEREIYEARLEVAKLFAAANKINRIPVASGEDWLGIVAAGKTYYDLRESLHQLGLDDEALQFYGVRLLKLGMIYPMETRIVREFARGLEEILVLEEKRSFIELHIRDILYNDASRPRIVGKRDEEDNFLVRGDHELDADEITKILAKRLPQRLPAEIIERRMAVLAAPQSTMLQMAATDSTPARQFHFCSGCPHNRSTVVPEGSLAGGGIGCHGMVLAMDRNTTGITHMGGEGVQWVGASFFSDMDHMFQNLGDGTLFHSGSLAIRQAIAANVNITYKILYNDAVAMTGGQPVDGNMPVPELTRFLQAEGVAKTIVVSHDTDQYPPEAAWADGVQIWHRDRLDEAQEALREIPGVTALIYDQPCAADLRRKRRRNEAPDPAMRVFINEAVCEGCGDCGVKSNCLSVFPVETEFGRKTQIHQSSCNKDYTCLDGDCPAFISVIPAEANGRTRSTINPIEIDDRDIPNPDYQVPSDANIYMMGIGGMGVVTANQILGTAAFIDGKHVRSLDQTGLSQKGGPVVSNLKIFANQAEASNKIASGEADAYIVFDVLTGTTDQNLSRARPEKTVAVVSSSKIPTGSMVTSSAVHFPAADFFKRRIDAKTRADKNVYLDAITLAENLFGSHMPANLLTIGAAFQAGLIPLSAEAIEKAITLNGVASKVNIAAFRAGRMLIADPDWIKSLKLSRGGALAADVELTPAARKLVDLVGAAGELKRRLELRVPELIDYQDPAYAKTYAEFVGRVFAAEQAALPGETRLSEAVAQYLFKLMAYKDEYEVARLHLKPEFSRAVAEQFGAGAKIAYRLHPPLLRALGMKKKLALGKWFDLGFHLLKRLKWLRGTRFDIFGYAEVRRVERQLIAEYRTLIEAALAELSADNYERAVEVANLPDMIRGYEEIKLRNVARFREELQRLSEESLTVAEPAI